MKKVVAFFLLLCAVGVAAVVGSLVIHFHDVSLADLLPDFSLSQTESVLVRKILPGFMGEFEANCRASVQDALEQQGRAAPPVSSEKIAALCSCSGRYVTNNISGDDIKAMTGAVLRGEKPRPTQHLLAVMGEAMRECQIRQ